MQSGETLDDMEKVSTGELIAVKPTPTWFLYVRYMFYILGFFGIWKIIDIIISICHHVTIY